MIKYKIPKAVKAGEKVSIAVIAHGPGYKTVRSERRRATVHGPSSDAICF